MNITKVDPFENVTREQRTAAKMAMANNMAEDAKRNAIEANAIGQEIVSKLGS